MSDIRKTMARRVSAARSRRLLGYPQLAEKGIPWSRMHINREEKADRFPKRVHIGPNTIAWFEDEIDAFIEQRAAKRDEAAA